MYLLNAALNYVTFLQQDRQFLLQFKCYLPFQTALLLLPSRHHQYQLLPCEYQCVM